MYYKKRTKFFVKNVHRDYFCKVIPKKKNLRNNITPNIYHLFFIYHVPSKQHRKYYVMKMIIKRLHFIFGLMIAILFISSSIKGQTYFSVLEPYKCKILSPRFFNTIDSIIDLEKLRKTREFYNVSLIIHPNKYDRSEWSEISGEVNLRDIDVIVSVFKSDIPRGIYAVKYKNKKFIFR